MNMKERALDRHNANPYPAYLPPETSGLTKHLRLRWHLAGVHLLLPQPARLMHWPVPHLKYLSPIPKRGRGGNHSLAQFCGL